MTTTTADIQTLAINAVRVLAIDGVQAANSGHPGLPLGAAPMAYALWAQHMRYNPRNPGWANRDRFILSAGHGSMLIYSLLHLTGFDVSLDDLKSFRKWGSKTPGHPEYGHTPGVETTTGPLGQGGANAVGMALAEAFLARHFNRGDHKVVDHYTYALIGDGDTMEGVFLEATALAGHWGLGKLIFLYDDNETTLDGPAELITTENILARFDAMGWHTTRVHDGNDVAAISQAISDAKSVTNKPSLISVKTVIGYGSPNKAGSSEAHGAPLGEDEVRLTKQALGWPSEEPFYVPGEALEHWREALDRGAADEAEWNQTFEAWSKAYPELAAQWEEAWAGRLPAGWDSDLPSFDAPIATRVASGKVLNAIAKHVPTMIGGDADLASSTKSLINGEDETAAGKPAARNIRYGVREHGMGAIANGLALHGGIVKTYTSTFFTFSDYMRPAVRLAALMNIPHINVFTHDSIGIGEDGPTHQPVEQLMAMRGIPNLHVFRPADANETAASWKQAMLLDGPASLVLTRQNLPVLGGDNVDGIYEGVAHGAYVLLDTADGDPDVLLLATGSEVEIAMEAFDQLEAEGIKARVVSMPCWELFEAQSDDYKASVIPPDVRARVSIEAGITQGWGGYVGLDGISIGVNTFGASGPYKKIYEAYGLTTEAVVTAAKSLI